MNHNLRVILTLAHPRLARSVLHTLQQTQLPHSHCGMCWLRLSVARERPSMLRMSYEAGNASALIYVCGSGLRMMDGLGPGIVRWPWFVAATTVIIVEASQNNASRYAAIVGHPRARPAADARPCYAVHVRRRCTV